MIHDETPHNYLMYQGYHKKGKVSVTGVTQDTGYAIILLDVRVRLSMMEGNTQKLP